MRRLSLPIEDLDSRSVPGDHHGLGSAGYSAAVLAHARRAVTILSGDAHVRISGNSLVVDWRPARQSENPIDRIIAELQKGRLAETTLVLQFLLSERPEDSDILYNLGMALSDGGQPDLAERYLRRLLRTDPDRTNGYAALGVALQRQGKHDEAIDVLRQGLAIAPENPWILRNLGAALLRQGSADEAVEHLRGAARQNPTDQRTWLGLAQALEEVGQGSEADQAYRKAVDLDPNTDGAEMARNSLRRIAEATFRSALPDVPRPDAVMYCLGALDTFAQMTPAEIQAVGLEIALLGTKGLNVNSPDVKHRLESLPGEFTGLHLVSLMYVAFKTIAPEQDIGFDLSKEYATALALRGEGTTRQAPGAT